MAQPKQPVAGYPSKGEAIIALHLQGLTPFMIAEKTGSTPGAVTQTIRVHKKKLEAASAGEAPAQKKKPGRKPKAAPIANNERPEATPGIWTPEKLAKARKLFGKTMIMIAEALQVPAAELLAYGLNGVLPPMGEKQRLGQLLSAMAEGRAPDALALPAPISEPEIDQVFLGNIEKPDDGPSRDDDEAELAALDEEDEDGEQSSEGAPAAEAADEPAPGPRLYRLTRDGGINYLHKNGISLTRDKAMAWQGTASDMEKLFKRSPEWREIDPERVVS